jgi:tetraacyldisaccharide 4'-kinase
LGGTGKTPVVLEISKFLKREGYNPCILLRGYKRKSKGPKLVSDGKKIFLSVEEAGDEAYLYVKIGLPVVVAEKRCEGLKLLPTDCNVLILDDAFQHLAIERDLDIVLLTGKELEEKILPFGRLREPLEVLKERGDYCLLTKGKNSDLENFCSRLGKPYGYLKLEGFKFLLNGSEEINFKNLKGKRLGLISAVGDNSAFKRQVEDLLKNYGFRLEKIYQFRDHCDYRGFQLEGNYIWITTFKDFVKLENRGTFVVVDRIFQLPEDLKDLILKKVKTFER